MYVYLNIYDTNINTFFIKLDIHYDKYISCIKIYTLICTQPYHFWYKFNIEYDKRHTIEYNIHGELNSRMLLPYYISYY